MKEHKAVKLTLKIWKKIAVHPGLEYDCKWDIKDECASKIGLFKYSCPCCEYSMTPHLGVDCKRCPMKSFWGEGKPDTLCLCSKTSPYREFSYGDVVEGAKGMVRLCDEAVEAWRDYSGLIKRVKKINPDAARYMRKEAMEIPGFSFARTLNSAFTLHRTPQGFQFWEEIDNVLQNR